MIETLKLPLTFDAERMAADVSRFGDEDWTPHFNTAYYEGDWSGIALRTSANAHVELYPDPTATHYVDTKRLGQCDYIPDVLREFECELRSARFLRLGAGATIKEHRDYDLSVDDGLARVHVPIITNPNVDFYLNGIRVEMSPGEAWYLNFNLPHSVENTGTETRVHLVFDCVVNDWLLQFFPKDQVQ